MTTKEYLSQIRRFDRMIKNKLMDIYQLKTMAYSVTSSNDGERIQTSSNKDKLGLVVSKIVDLENEVDSMVDNRSLIVSRIDNMEDTEMYDVLAKKFILGKDLKAIAIERGFTYRHINRIYNNAIKEFEEKYGKNYL
jgi:hypothetical protein